MCDSARVLTSIPIFPLPEVVLFPHQMLPLHIFEERYRDMVADALRGRQLIAVALLCRGYERLYFTQIAPICEVVGVGEIVDASPLPDGRYDILLRGRCRARILREVRGHSYRMAELRVLPSTHFPDATETDLLRQELRNALVTNLCRWPQLQTQCVRLLDRDTPLEVVVNLVAAELPVSGRLRQTLLETSDVTQRTCRLIRQLERIGNTARDTRRQPIVSPCEWN